MLVQGNNELELGVLTKTVLAPINHFLGWVQGLWAIIHNLKVNLNCSILQKGCQSASILHKQKLSEFVSKGRSYISLALMFFEGLDKDTKIHVGIFSLLNKC